MHSNGKTWAPIYGFFKKMLANTLLKDANWGLILAALLCLICLAYVAGHLIATLSSLLIDRILVHKGYGYPYINLLDIGALKRSDYEVASRAYYRGFFFWVNTFLLILYLYLCNYYINFSAIAFRMVILALSVFMILFVFIKVVFASRHRKKKDTRAFSQLVKPYSGLYDILSGFLAKYINTKRAFNEEFAKKFKRIFHSMYDLNPEDAETNVFWLPFIFISEKSEYAGATAGNWLNLYGYARNLAFSFYLAFLYSGGMFSLQIKKVDPTMHPRFFAYPIVLFLLFVFMLIRFYYLYASYYTKFIFRAFYALNQIEKNVHTPEKPHKH